MLAADNSLRVADNGGQQMSEKIHGKTETFAIVISA